MIPLPPRSTRTYTLFPDTTLFRSRAHEHDERRLGVPGAQHDRRAGLNKAGEVENVAVLAELVVRVAIAQALGRRRQDERGARAEQLHETRSEEHTSELQSLMRISYAVFCLKKKKQNNKPQST